MAILRSTMLHTWGVNLETVGDSTGEIAIDVAGNRACKPAFERS